MQHSSMTLFCDACGLANEPDASCCVACQHTLSQMAPTQQIAPVNSSPPVVREVLAGSAPASPSPIENISPGTILAGRYKIEKEIGQGGFSTVYRAVDLTRRNKYQVAIKRIQLSALTPAQIIDATETFNREVSILSQFKGTRGIPTFYEHLTDPENWYLVMEYIQGSTLEEFLQNTSRGYVNEKETISIGITLAQILQELHRNHPPVIFRDVKPANIMITPERELFLIDFGIARHFTFGKKRDTTPFGSPGYAPPEQYGRAQTDRRADVYSLGATLQTLFTGRDPQELAEDKPSCNPHQPSTAFRKLLDEMLAPEITERPVDMLYVQTRLERILNPAPRPVSINPNAPLTSSKMPTRGIGSLIWIVLLFLNFLTISGNRVSSWLWFVLVVAGGIAVILVLIARARPKWFKKSKRITR